MNVVRTRAFHGPNVWAGVPVFEAELDGEAPLDALRSLLERVSGRPVDVFSRGSLLAFPFEDETVARACVDAACGADVDLSFAEDILMGPNTRALFDAAVRRGIPVRRLDQGSLLQLGHGCKQRRLRGAFTDRTTSIGEHIGWEKPIAKMLLRAVGVPVPEGRVVTGAEDAWRAACEIGAPVVVKPESANHGRNVFIGLRTREEVTAAFEAAGGTVIVERMIPGSEHRVLVVNGEAVAATRGDPLYVTGDGRRSVAELVDEVNLDPRRGESIHHPLYPVSFDETTLAVLAGQELTSESVPAEGAKVLIQQNGNLATDVTDTIHPINRYICRLAARTVDLDVAGIDLVVEDLARPLSEQGGAILEVNAMPGLQMHLHPGQGQSRPVDDIIVGTLFGPGEDGRIPIVAVCGDPEEVRKRLKMAGRMVKTAGPDAASIRDLLLHPYLAVAVVQVDAAQVLEQGLGFDRCHVILGLGTLPEEAQRVLRESLMPGGVIAETVAEAAEAALR